MSDSLAAVTAPAVCAEDVRVTYRGRTVVDVPSITLASGQTYALLGASGAGKSTLLRVLGLLERPTRGRVLFDGSTVRTGDLVARRRIAAVFQKPYLLRGTVADNVAYGLRLRGISPAERAGRVAASLQRVGLAGWELRSALTLSGGEAQRVALARALVLEPSFLLLDEPLSYMDPLLKRSLSVEFAEILAGERITALYVTHDQDEAAVVADRIGVMREGRIVAEGDPDTVLGLPADPWHASFVDMEPSLPGRVTASVDGLAEIAVDGVSVYATTGFATGSDVLLAVRPEDVTLWESGVQMPAGSARNRLACVVEETLPRGGSVRVVVRSGGARFAASISRASAAELGVAPGSHLVASFKATAVRVRLLGG
ncbi:MAG TPA: ABC transporter ATP-binding protein [Coriobacteriia bacterium]